MTDQETYAFAPGGACVLRGSDGACIPCDEANADWRAVLAWQAEGGVIAPTPAPTFDPAAVGEECRRRIYAIASQAAQTNMAAARAADLLTKDENSAFAAGLGWITMMRNACAALIEAKDETFADDAQWPNCPPAVVALAAKF